MRILFIGHESDLNGASKSLLNIISELETKHEVYVLTAYGSGSFYEELCKHNVTVLVKPYGRWCVYSRSWKNRLKQIVTYHLHTRIVEMATARDMADYILEHKIDIIHSNTSVIRIGALISKLTGIPHVWHIREFGDLDFEMYPLIPRKQFFYQMNHYCDAFIFISKAVYQHYSLLDDSKKHIIYNGIDSGSSSMEEKLEKKDHLVFLIAGRISPAKGQNDAVKAAIELLKEGTQNFSLWIAGDGTLSFPIPKEYQPHIKLLGLVKDMTSLRKQVDIELVCSRAEAFGRVTAEAMMSGIPVIGSNTGGTTELIKNGQTGLLYDYGNITELADKMRWMIQNREKRLDMGRNARKYAQEHFTIKRCVEEIEELYHAVLGGEYEPDSKEDLP